MNEIKIHKVNLGYDVEEEIKKEINNEISEQTIEDAKDIIDALSDKPSNKKAIEKIESEKKLEEIYQIIKDDGSISKDRMNEITGKNTISSVNLLRNYFLKHYECKLIKKGKDSYTID